MVLNYKVTGWADIEFMTRTLFLKVINDNFLPDVIVGVARGGWIPARLLSDLFERKKKHTILASMKVEFYSGIGLTRERPIISQDLSYPSIQGKKILVVDDIADTGKSLETVVDFLNFKGPEIIKIATLFYKEKSIVKPDYFMETTESWIVFPHEYFEFLALKVQEENLWDKDKDELIKYFTGLGMSFETVTFYLDNLLDAKRDATG
ncbi:MAG: phosphoribosyltransferase [Candidatus Hodarchaeales archaeon]|jgi:hypoxanthine phosphoribosyltransferase